MYGIQSLLASLIFSRVRFTSGVSLSLETIETTVVVLILMFTFFSHSIGRNQE